MSTLTPQARHTIRGSGLTIAAYVRMHFPAENVVLRTARRWLGDSCGCPDDRCVGFHHGEGEECRCLAALLAGGGAW